MRVTHFMRVTSCGSLTHNLCVFPLTRAEQFGPSHHITILGPSEVSELLRAGRSLGSTGSTGSRSIPMDQSWETADALAKTCEEQAGFNENVENMMPVFIENV